MLEVGDNEPDSMTKTGADGDIPALREAAWRISRGSQRAWTAVDRGPHRYDLEGRHNGGGQVEATTGKTFGVTGIACHARYGPTGRRSGSARVGAALGMAWSGRPRCGG